MKPDHRPPNAKRRQSIPVRKCVIVTERCSQVTPQGWSEPHPWQLRVAQSPQQRRFQLRERRAVWSAAQLSSLALVRAWPLPQFASSLSLSQPWLPCVSYRVLSLPFSFVLLNPSCAWPWLPRSDSCFATHWRWITESRQPIKRVINRTLRCLSSPAHDDRGCANQRGSAIIAMSGRGFPSPWASSSTSTIRWTASITPWGHITLAASPCRTLRMSGGNMALPMSISATSRRTTNPTASWCRSRWRWGHDSGQALTDVYFEEEPRRQSVAK